MSARKRPLADISQSTSTPARNAPSTPHAIRALQQRSGAKIRSLRSTRHVTTDIVRPDSIRGVLRQFAKISAPITEKRIETSSNPTANKENRTPGHAKEDESDTALLNKPVLTLAIEESLEEDDSSLPVAPTPSVLPDDDDDYEQPTITFQNIARIPITGTDSPASNRRKSHVTTINSEPVVLDDQEDQDADLTVMTERGRRAVSEEATGRFSRYSFGTIRMSDFGSELEIRRDTDKHEKSLFLNSDDYAPHGEDDLLHDDETEAIRRLHYSASPETVNDTIRFSVSGNESFQLDIPVHQDEASARNLHKGDLAHGVAVRLEQDRLVHVNRGKAAIDDDEVEAEPASRRQTLLEVATTTSHASRRKRLKLTRHGTTVPSLPASLIKRIVLESYEKRSKQKPKLGRDHMKALEQATEWFFEQAGEDLAAYSSHARRKTRVSMEDALLLIRRQKVLSDEGDLSKLAKSWLPKEILKQLDVPDVV